MSVKPCVFCGKVNDFLMFCEGVCMHCADALQTKGLMIRPLSVDAAERARAERLGEALEVIRQAGMNTHPTAVWMQMVAAHAIDPRVPDPGMQPLDDDLADGEPPAKPASLPGRVRPDALGRPSVERTTDTTEKPAKHPHDDGGFSHDCKPPKPASLFIATSRCKGEMPNPEPIELSAEEIQKFADPLADAARDINTAHLGKNFFPKKAELEKKEEKT